MTLVEGEIEEIVAICIDECLDNIGRGFKSIFYWSLENRAGVRRDEIVSKPEKFAMYIDTMFPLNAAVVKEEIKENLCQELGIPNLCLDLSVLIRYAAGKANIPSRRLDTLQSNASHHF